MPLEYIVMIGCSVCGGRTVPYLVPKLDRETSAVVVVPHVDSTTIRRGLESKGIMPINVGPDFPERYVNAGDVYIHVGSRCGVQFKNGSIGPSEGTHKTVDTSLSNAAAEYGSRCIGVILSGAGDDGSLGVKAIKNAGGKVFTQDEEGELIDGTYLRLSGGDDYPTEYFWEMPRAARASVMVDFDGSLDELAEALNRLIGQQEGG